MNSRNKPKPIERNDQPPLIPASPDMEDFNVNNTSTDSTKNGAPEETSSPKIASITEPDFTPKASDKTITSESQPDDDPRLIEDIPGYIQPPSDPRPIPEFTDTPPTEPPLDETVRPRNGSSKTIQSPNAIPHEAPETPPENEDDIHETEDPLNEDDPPKPPPPTEDEKAHEDEENTDNKKKPGKPQRKTAFWLVTPIVILIIGVILSGILFPSIVSFLGKAFVGFTLGIFFLFLMLGIFVVLGLRDQAKTLLELIFEGGVKYIDLAEFFSDLWDDIIKLIQDIILFFAPIAAIILAIFFYYIVMYAFRFVAVRSDVTTFTIILTVILACITAALGLSKFGEADDSYSFRSQLSFRFGRIFVDAIEIVVIVIFLTIDLPNPFFLPQELHGEVTAYAFGIDLMQRGIDPNGFITTLRIAGLAVFVEVVRKLYRVAASMILRYKELKDRAKEQKIPITTPEDMFELIRKAARLAYRDNLDDLTKFLGFTTVLILVFLFFPRLKLVSLLVFNLTNLVWDIIVPSRTIREVKSEDLLSRLIAKALKI